jgi:Kef-type K+ transport system membrane component KefB
MELGVLRSREGVAILGAAVIDDVMGIILLSLVVAFAKASAAAGVDVSQVGGVALRIVVYFILGLVAQTEFKKQIDGGIHPRAYSMFAPVFFVSIGLEGQRRVLANTSASRSRWLLSRSSRSGSGRDCLRACAGSRTSSRSVWV